MAYNNSEHGFSANTPAMTNMVLQANGPDVQLPDTSYIREAELTRDSGDLILKTADNQITIENYFSVETKPVLTGPDGSILSPKLVESFVKSGQEYASNFSMTDESPVGNIAEINGDATVTRVDGSTESITIGTEIYNGDIVETSADGAVNITFIDDSSFAVSEGARLSIDEYVFDPSTESGQTDFSVLKGMFVYTSGLIGRDDPDDVTIDTPVGSIGIRGTIIAGNVDNGEITVVEGAIVLRDFNGNEVTLANQFETARFDLGGKGIESMGELSAGDVAGKFASISNVSPTLFSSIDDAASENKADGAAEESAQDAETEEAAEEAQESEGQTTTEEAPETEAATEAETEADSDTEVASEGEAEAQAEATTENAEPDAETAEQPANRPNANADNKAAEGPKAQADNNPEAADGPAEGSQPEININMPEIAQPIAENTAGPANNPMATARPAMANPANHSPNTHNGPNAQNGPLTQPETTINPALFNNDTINDGPINVAPTVLTNNIPNPDFGFTLKDGDNSVGTKVFEFYFDKLFTDADNDDLRFELSDASMAKLESLQEGDASNVNLLDLTEFADGTGNITDILNQSGENAGFNFDSANGKLTLYINEAAEFTGTDESFTLEVRALDNAGNSSDFVDATFTAYEAATSISASTGSTVSVEHLGGATANLTSSSAFLTVTGDSGNATVFAEDGKTLIILNSLENTTVFNGEGSKTISITNNSVNNTVFGSDSESSSDTFVVNNVNNNIYGMGGDDSITINLDDDANGLNTSTTTINGGTNAVSKAQAIASGDSTAVADNAKGDTLNLFNDSGPQETIDFSAIGANIQGFEHLQLSGTSGVKVTLSVDDVISITDEHNTLLISGDSNDHVALDAGDFQKESYTETIDNEVYDVYTSTSGENVTLFVDSDIVDTGAAIT